MGNRTMDTGTAILELEQLTETTAIVKRVISRKRQYPRVNGLVRLNWDTPIRSNPPPYQGLGDDAGRVLELSGIA